MSWVAAASIAAAYGYVAVRLTFVGSLLHADAHLPPVAYGPRLHSQNGERKMKKLLLATAALLLATASANAGSVVFGFEFDNGTIQLAGPFGSTQTVGPLDPFNGPFIVQQATGSTQPFVVPPDVLDTNTLDVVNTTATNVAFHIFVSAKDVPVSGLQTITSSFDSVGLTSGWTVTETSFIGNANQFFFVGGLGTQLATDTFNGVAGSGAFINTVNLGAGPFNSFNVEYTINTNGILGEANIGINLSAVPGPIVGAGLPGLVVACGGLLALARRRRRQLVA